MTIQCPKPNDHCEMSYPTLKYRNRTHRARSRVRAGSRRGSGRARGCWSQGGPHALWRASWVWIRERFFRWKQNAAFVAEMDRILAQMASVASHPTRKPPSRLMPELDDDVFDDPEELAVNARIFKQVQEMTNRAIKAGLCNKSPRH
jgi:hypothetical protein